MLTTRKTSGFTIIEIIFVLAIAGLIMIMSFLAFSTAQRSKRDAQRKADLSKINQNIGSWTSENHGILPSTPSELQVASRNDSADAASIPVTPEGGHYNVNVGSVSTDCDPSTLNYIYYERINDRSYKIKICLESGEFSENL